MTDISTEELIRLRKNANSACYEWTIANERAREAHERWIIAFTKSLVAGGDKELWKRELELAKGRDR